MSLSVRAAITEITARRCSMDVIEVVATAVLHLNIDGPMAAFPIIGKTDLSCHIAFVSLGMSSV